MKLDSDPYGLGMGRASTVSNASLVRLHDFFLKVKSVSTYKQLLLILGHKSLTQNDFHFFTIATKVGFFWSFSYNDLFSDLTVQFSSKCRLLSSVAGYFDVIPDDSERSFELNWASPGERSN